MRITLFGQKKTDRNKICLSSIKFRSGNLPYRLPKCANFRQAWQTYPRAYGADLLSTDFVVTLLGSSPRMRGKFFLLCSMIPDIRTHPRAYGADIVSSAATPLLKDSSPCIRGRYNVMFDYNFIRRAIPVRTGWICRSLNLVLFCTAHPRVYGADSPTTVHPVPSMGSSPCVRGRENRYPQKIWPKRFIPVRTGQSI